MAEDARVQRVQWVQQKTPAGGSRRCGCLTNLKVSVYLTREPPLAEWPWW
jgi:hypothetical protein